MKVICECSLYFIPGKPNCIRKISAIVFPNARNINPYHMRPVTVLILDWWQQCTDKSAAAIRSISWLASIKSSTSKPRFDLINRPTPIKITRCLKNSLDPWWMCNSLPLFFSLAAFYTGIPLLYLYFINKHEKQFL